MKLTKSAVGKIIDAFLQHIAKHWNEYQKSLPRLRRTLMVYNEFAYGIRFLPENAGCTIEFNPKYPLIEDLKYAFGDRFTEEIGNLVYDAWPLRKKSEQWEGYEEPIPDTPAALRRKHPELFKTNDDARRHMYEAGGTGYGDFCGKRMLLGPCGMPQIWYRGFTTVKEFPWQRKFLDGVRNNPRVQLGVQLMKKELFVEKRRHDRKEQLWRKIQMLQKQLAKFLEEHSRLR